MYSALDGRPTTAQTRRNVLAPNTGEADNGQGPVQAQPHRHRRRVDAGKGHATTRYRCQTVVIVGLVVVVSGIVRSASLPASVPSLIAIVVVVVVIVVGVRLRYMPVVRPDVNGVYRRRNKGRQGEEGGQRPSQGQQGPLGGDRRPAEGGRHGLFLFKCVQRAIALRCCAVALVFARGKNGELNGERYARSAD